MLKIKVHVKDYRLKIGYGNVQHVAVDMIMGIFTIIVLTAEER
jgi:hypothetical protein